MKKIIAFIQNNFISCVCLFLAATIFTGSLTLAKYISTETPNVGSSAGSFHCSGSVDDVSSLSFANLDFWGGSEKDTPMNAIHSLNFLVNNYEERTDGESVTKHVSVAKMGYTLIFSAPAIFLEKLAMQLFESPDTVMTPQIVLADLLATANGGKFKTKDSKDYNGTEYTDFEFTVNVSDGGVANAYTATSELPDGKGNMVLKVEPFMQTMTQTLKFRLWDVSKLTSESNKTVDHEGGDLVAPLYADVHADVLCYKISISMPQFTLAAGVEEQDRYSLRFVTTSAINDHELGGFLTNDQAGNRLENAYSGKTAYFKTMTETVTDKDSSGNVTERNTYYVIGNPRAYNPGVEKSEPKVTTEYVKEYAEKVTTTVNNAPERYIYFNHYNNNNNIATEDSATYRICVSKGASYVQEDFFSYSDSVSNFAVTTTETETVKTKINTSGNTETITQDIKLKTVKKINKNSKTTATTTTTITRSSGTITIQEKNGDSWDDSGTLSSITLKNSSAPTEITLPDETYSREIVRVTSYAESITFKKVYRRVEDAEGKVTLTEYADKDHAFELFDGVIQKYFLSQCYSKSYPFKVNVYFEQLQS